MTTLGLGSAAVPSGEVAVSFNRGWLRHFRVALSSAGGAAVIFAVFELLQKQPADGFKLLSEWGPWPIIALVALVMLGSFFSRMNETVSTTFSAIVTSVERQADATGKTADALTRLAGQGDRQAEQVQRLAIYAAQEFPGVYERFDRQDEVLQGLADAVKDLRVRLDRSMGEKDGSGT